jgi:hypothetical protein
MLQRIDHLDDAKLKALIEKHSAESDVTIDEYVRNRKIGLGKSVTKHKLIYLDTRYWIILREVLLGRRPDPSSVRLLDCLRLHAQKREIICPISESVFIEMLKQQDLRTRRKTAELIDELSLGVTLASEPIRIGTEIAHFFYSHDQRISIYPLKWLIWSKLSHVFGDMYPTNTGLSPDRELVMQKVYFDQIWESSLTEIADMIGDKEVPVFDFKDLASEANEALGKISGEIQSFKQVYEEEIAGSLSRYMPVAQKILEDIFKRGGGVMPMQALRKTEIARLLPTLHIHARCHASVRWDKKRKLKGNDFYDFHHAAAAVPYCDVFLTERPLQAMLKADHLKINQDFDCNIISSISEAVEFLERE